MDNQSRHNVLYRFLDWHPARISIFADLIWGVIKAKTIKIKELAMHISSQGNLHATIISIAPLLLQQILKI